METGPGMPAEPIEDEYVVSLGAIFKVVWRRLWIILLVAIVFTGAAVGISLAQAPVYETSITILVQQPRGTNEAAISAYDLELLTQTMASGVDSRPVMEATIRQLGLQATSESLLENLRVEQIPETQFIQVYYRAPSPEKAQQVVNTVGDQFSKQISKMSPSAYSLTAPVWERAVLPSEPVSPQPLRNGLLALALGLMLGVGLAVLLEFLDDSWRSPEELEQVSGAPTFGTIPQFELSSSGKGRG